jgi:hypothetical protein
MLTGASYPPCGSMRWKFPFLPRFHALVEYLPGYLAATPMAGAIAAMEDARRTALFEDLLTELQPYVDDTGLAVPMECLVLVART